MVPRPTRRTLLRSTAFAATAGLAGCSAVNPFSSSGGADAGNDAYGILLTNETESTYTVTVTAGPRFEDGGPTFEESATVDPGEDHEWNHVLTEEKQYLVEATVQGVNFYTNEQQNRRTVSVGSPSAPDDENVVVRVTPYFDTVTAWVEFGHNRSEDEP